MRKTIAILLATGMAFAGGFTVRIPVQSKTEVIALAETGVHLLDARVCKTQTGRTVRWFEENGYLTALINDDDIKMLQNAGYDFSEPVPFIRNSAPAADGKTPPDQFGWPKTMSGWPTINGQSVTIDDINHDGSPEIFLSNSEGYVYMWKPNGTFVPGYPKNPYRRFIGFDPSTGDSVFTSWASTGSRETAASGDITGDGSNEFVFGKDIGNIFAFQYHYLPPGSFPWEFPLLTFSNDPAIADLNGDGIDELVLMMYLDDYYYPNAPAYLHVFRSDGSELSGWPVQIPVQSESSPVLGDIDQDGETEIVVGSGRNLGLGIPGRIYAFNLDGGICDGFPIEIGYGVESTASLADIDMNGSTDILIRVKPSDKNINGVYAYNGQGQLLPGYPAVIGSGGTVGAPAIADMDGDGLPEIAIGTVEAVDLGKIWVFENDGSLKANFPQPVYATWVEESVILADVSGDSLPDVVCGTNGLSGDPAKLWAFDHTGATVSGFPITISGTFSSLESAPAAADIDGDGDLEIFSASHDGIVFCWDTDGRPSKTDEWPVYKYNAARTGNNNATATSTTESASVPPDSPVLFPAYPNPFNARTTVSFVLPDQARISISVFDVRGGKVEGLASGIFSAGRHQVYWIAGGARTASGVYLIRLEAELRNGKIWQNTVKTVLLK